MFETLQRNDGSTGQTTTIDGSTELILDNDYATKIAAFVASANSEIRLCAYAWRWYVNEPEIPIQKLNIALLNAYSRGVKVRALVDTEAQMNVFRKIGFQCRSVVNTRMLHTKAFCIDSKTLVIGSHNMTKRATTDNYEMSIATQDPECILLFQDYFDRMWDSRG